MRTLETPEIFLTCAFCLDPLAAMVMQLWLLNSFILTLMALVAEGYRCSRPGARSDRLLCNKNTLFHMY